MILVSILFGASLAISISGSLALGALLLLLVAGRAVREKKAGGPPTFLEWSLWGLFLWTTFSSVLQNAGTIFEIISWQSAFAVFFLVARFLHPEEIKKALLGYVVAGVVAGLWGFLQPFTGVVFDPNIPHTYRPSWALSWPQGIVRYLAVNVDRAQGPRSHPLTYAETIMPAALILLASLVSNYRERSPLKRQIWPAIGFLLLVGGLIASQSRGVWLGCGIALFILSFSLSMRSRLVLFGGTLLALSALLIASPLYRARMMSIVSLQSGRTSDRLSGEIRFQLWHQSIEHIRQKPVLGWGLKKAVLETIEPNYHKPKFWTESHDIFLQTAMESGVGGLIFFLMILFSSLRLIWNRPFPEKLLFLAVFAAFIVAGFTESWTRDKEPALLFWGFIGLLTRRDV